LKRTSTSCAPRSSKTYEADGIGRRRFDKAFRDRVAPVFRKRWTSGWPELDRRPARPTRPSAASLVADAQQIIQEYTSFVSSSQIVTDLDTNPFAAIAIKQTVAGTLASRQGAALI